MKFEGPEVEIRWRFLGKDLPFDEMEQAEMIVGKLVAPMLRDQKRPDFKPDNVYEISLRIREGTL